MRILVLGPHSDRLQTIIGDHLIQTTQSPLTLAEVSRFNPHLLLSYGYRHLVPREVLAGASFNAINLHVSLLPWNRGADPNLWSWFSNTPKGVSIHWMTEGLDQGDIIAQMEVALDPQSTLGESYSVLQASMCSALASSWSDIESGTAPHDPQEHGGSHHRSSDKQPHAHALTDGFNTRCQQLVDYGEANGLWISQ